MTLLLLDFGPTSHSRRNFNSELTLSGIHIGMKGLGQTGSKRKSKRLVNYSKLVVCKLVVCVRPGVSASTRCAFSTWLFCIDGCGLFPPYSFAWMVMDIWTLLFCKRKKGKVKEKEEEGEDTTRGRWEIRKQQAEKKEEGESICKVYQPHKFRWS